MVGKQQRRCCSRSVWGTRPLSLSLSYWCWFDCGEDKTSSRQTRGRNYTRYTAVKVGEPQQSNSMSQSRWAETERGESHLWNKLKMGTQKQSCCHLWNDAIHYLWTWQQWSLYYVDNTFSWLSRPQQQHTVIHTHTHRWRTDWPLWLLVSMKTQPYHTHMQVLHAYVLLSSGLVLFQQHAAFKQTHLIVKDVKKPRVSSS